MAKKTQPAADARPTELVISKEEFTTALEKMIDKGEIIKQGQIQSLAELEIKKKAFLHWNSYNLEFLKQAFNKEHNEYKQEYDNAGNGYLGFLMSGRRPETSAERIESFSDKLSEKIDSLIKLKAKVELLKSAIPAVKSESLAAPLKGTRDKTRVFIVHGHDEEVQAKVARFVQKMGFVPIILHEQASSGKTIIEKIEEYTNVGFGIVLYTPCDKGGKDEKPIQLRHRARQNVVFEHGYLIGKIGRDNVCALVKNEIETPTDISGVVYIQMDNANAWHISLAKEMRNSGYQVDMNKVI